MLKNRKSFGTFKNSWRVGGNGARDETSPAVVIVLRTSLATFGQTSLLSVNGLSTWYTHTSSGLPSLTSPLTLSLLLTLQTALPLNDSVSTPYASKLPARLLLAQRTASKCPRQSKGAIFTMTCGDAALILCSHVPGECTSATP